MRPARFISSRKIYARRGLSRHKNICARRGLSRYKTHALGAAYLCHGRAWPGHPRLVAPRKVQSWVAGTRPAMTQKHVHSARFISLQNTCARRGLSRYKHMRSARLISSRNTSARRGLSRHKSICARRGLSVSWPGLARPPTACGAQESPVVGGRHEAGHDTKTYTLGAIYLVTETHTPGAIYLVTKTSAPRLAAHRFRMASSRTRPPSPDCGDEST